MSYDRLAESIRLIENGPPETAPEQLSRRVRFVPLAVDVIGDLAVTMFVRRSVSGVPEAEDHALERGPDGWRLLGGSGGGAPDDVLMDRLSAAALGQLVRGHGHGSTSLSHRAGRFGVRPPFRYLHYGEYRVAREVATVVVVRSRLFARWRAQGASPIWAPGRGWTAAGRDRVHGTVAAARRLVGGRPIAVPRHGNVVVAWTSRRPPRLVPLDTGGRPLGVLSAEPRWPPGHRPPLRYRARLRHPWLSRWLPRHRRATPGWAPLEYRDEKPRDDRQDGRQ